jgi:GTPase
MFADKVEITLEAGKGGDGRLSFRTEKYRPRGGPDGGDGGRGASIVFEVDHNLNTLSAFRHQKQLKAEPGEMGGTNRRHGKAGEDLVVKVPQGTVVLCEDVLLADLSELGQRYVAAKGGRGGFGNAHFTSSVRQAPRAVEVGDAGEHKLVTLELKLVADIGLVGLPNAGKSTLLSVISNAKPAIGDYPFTTLVPNLGVVDIDKTSVLVADIPGLIEGASEGKGLGDEFLRHIERTAVILHLMDGHSQDVVGDYKTIQGELKNYAIDLTPKPQILILSKTDGLEPKDLKAKQKALAKVSKQDVLVISAVAHKGLAELLRAALPLVEAERKRRAALVKQQERVVIDEASQPELWSVVRDGRIFVVKGQKLEGFARRTRWDNDESVDRLRDILHKQGVDKELAKLGAEPGDIIEIAGHSVEWTGI